MNKVYIYLLLTKQICRNLLGLKLLFERLMFANNLIAMRQETFCSRCLLMILSRELWEISSRLAGETEAKGWGEVLLIRHVTCGHKQQRRRAEECFGVPGLATGRFPIRWQMLCFTPCRYHSAKPLLTHSSPSGRCLVPVSPSQSAAATCAVRHRVQSGIKFIWVLPAGLWRNFSKIASYSF